MAPANVEPPESSKLVGVKLRGREVLSFLAKEKLTESELLIVLASLWVMACPFKTKA